VFVESVVAATQSSTYPTSQAGSYTVPGASPYGATQTLVTPGGAYAAPSGQPGNTWFYCKMLVYLVCGRHYFGVIHMLQYTCDECRNDWLKIKTSGHLYATNYRETIAAAGLQFKVVYW